MFPRCLLGTRETPHVSRCHFGTVTITILIHQRGAYVALGRFGLTVIGLRVAQALPNKTNFNSTQRANSPIVIATSRASCSASVAPTNIVALIVLLRVPGIHKSSLLIRN
jgi:hypothetical protein